jgi:DNA uptake protein ComE-like DNA-binding protein
LRSDRRGIALVLVLWILAALIALAAGLATMTHSEVQISRNYGDLIRCRWAARSGENRGIIEVEKLAKDGRGLSDSQIKLSSEQDGIDLGDASFEALISDEAGKVNINTASAETLEALFGSKEIAACIIDWRDKDDQPQPMGAENEYYSGLSMPYRCKNAQFSTIRELFLVKGITREMLSAPATEDGRSLEDLLTVYSRDENKTSDGKDRLNVKSASKDQMKTQLGDVLNDKDIDAIIKWRGERQMSSAAEIATVPGLDRDKVKNIYDKLTVSDEKVSPGLVNINTAPVEVLAATPGIDRGIAEEITTYRTRHGAFSDVGQLLDITSISTELFARCAGTLTAKSKVFSIVSTGRIEKVQSSRTITAVVDALDGRSARIVYWRE